MNINENYIIEEEYIVYRDSQSIRSKGDSNPEDILKELWFLF
jgi:hypothetical protein